MVSFSDCGTKVPCRAKLASVPHWTSIVGARGTAGRDEEPNIISVKVLSYSSGRWVRDILRSACRNSFRGWWRRCPTGGPMDGGIALRPAYKPSWLVLLGRGMDPFCSRVAATSTSAEAWCSTGVWGWGGGGGGGGIIDDEAGCIMSGNAPCIWGRFCMGDCRVVAGCWPYEVV